MKNIKNYTLILTIFIIVSLFTACSRSATSVLKKEPIFGQNLQYTKVGKIVLNKEVQALVNITYLNSVESSVWDNGKQNFLVGSYKAEDTNTTYSLTLNGKKAIKIKKIGKNDQIFQNIALKNNWANYQINTFDTVENQQLHLVFKDSLEHNITITFLKE